MTTFRFETMKQCKKCGTEKPLTEFYHNRRMADGHFNECKSCVISAAKECAIKNRKPAKPKQRRPRIAGRGYVKVFVPGHPRARQDFVLEHVYLAEKALGHALPEGAEVHHVNGNRQDNRPHNLVVCPNHAYHMMLHRRQRALKECGNANAHRCSVCGKYDPQEGMTVKDRGGDGRFVAYHRSCRAARARARTARLSRFI